MPESTIDERVTQLETDLALARHNIAQLMMWVEAHILATETADARKTRADRHFLRSRVDD